MLFKTAPKMGLPASFSFLTAVAAAFRLTVLYFMTKITPSTLGIMLSASLTAAKGGESIIILS